MNAHASFYNNNSYDFSYCELSRFFNKPNLLVTCLEPMIRALGCVESQRTVVERLPYFEQSLNLNDFCNVVESFGFKKHRFETSLLQIKANMLPCLFYHDETTILIITDRNENTLEVINPENNKHETIEAKDVSGDLLFFKKIDKVKTRKNASWMMGLLSEQKKPLIQILLISLFLNILGLTIPLFVMAIYDQVITSSSMHILEEFFLGMIIILSGLFVMQTIRSKILYYLGARLDLIVGKKIFAKLLDLPLSRIESATVGSQISRIRDFDSVREFFTGPLVPIIVELPFAIVFMVVLALLAGNLFLVPVAMFSLFLLMTILFKNFTHKKTCEHAKNNSDKQEFIVEALNKLKTLKTCGLENTWVDRYKEISAKASISNYRSTLLTNLFASLSDALVMLTGILFVVLAVGHVVAGELTVGALIASMMLLWKVLVPIKNLFSNYTRVDQVVSSIKQISALINIASENTNSEHKAKINETLGRIDFRNVSFRYHPDMPPAVLGVNFSINPGETVVIMGKNGSGKSSLLRLLTRLYTPQAGNILLDRKDVRQMDVRNLRHLFGYILQNNQFFYGTIAQNMKMVRPLASMSEIAHACRLAGIYDDIINLREGFETRIRENSRGELSTSFLQRLSLARAFLKEPKVILLDEPSNNLDNKENNNLLNTLQYFKKKSTVMMVTHRPSHLDIADRVLVMERGQLIFNGTPEDARKKLPKEFF